MGMAAVPNGTRRCCSSSALVCFSFSHKTIKPPSSVLRHLPKLCGAKRARLCCGARRRIPNLLQRRLSKRNVRCATWVAKTPEVMSRSQKKHLPHQLHKVFGAVSPRRTFEKEVCRSTDDKMLNQRLVSSCTDKKAKLHVQRFWTRPQGLRWNESSHTI